MNNTTTKNTQSAQLNAASSDAKFVSSFMALHMSALSFLQERSLNLLNNINPGENQTTRKPLLTLINMKNQTKKQILMSCLIALSSLILASGAFAANISSNKDGSWSSPSTWNGGVVPVAGDNVTIDDDVTISSSSTVSIANLTISSMKQLTNEGQLTITGNFSNSGTANFNTSGNTIIFSGSNTITLPRNFSFYNLTIGSGSTLNTYGSTSSTNNFSVANNLVITGTLVLQNVRSSGTATRTLKNITINSGGTLTESGSIALSITGDFTNNGTFTANSAVHTLTGTGVNISGTVNLGSVVINGTITNNALLTVSDFTINSTKTFTMGSSTGMTVTGNFVNNGTFTKSAAAVTFSGSSDQTISGSASSTNFNTLVIDKSTSSNTVTLSSAVKIYKTLTVTKGKLASAGNLTIKSTSTETARVGTIVSADASITGDVTVECFIPAGTRSHRFLSSAVNSVNIFDNWQEAGARTAGYGIQITGTSANAAVAPAGLVNATTGLDYSPLSGNSLLTLTNGTSFSQVTNTKTTNFTPGLGYSAYIRGDRTNDLYSNTAPTTNTSTTIRATGPLNQGDYTVSLASGWNLVGNPYASQIDWRSLSWLVVRLLNGKIDEAIYCLNPDASVGTTNRFGCYVGNIGTNGWKSTGALLASGQGFYVHTTAATTLTFKESYKTTSTAIGYFKNNSVADLLRVEYIYNGVHQDDIAINFSNEGKTNFDRSIDAETMGSATFGIASLKGTSRLAISTKPVFETVDTVALSVMANITGKFTLKFTAMESFGGMTQIILIDKFLNKMISLDQAVNYSFDITADPNSKGNSRFAILFSKVGTAAFTTGLANATEELANVSLYPNPATSTINIACSNANVKDFSYEIYNQMGQSVSTGAGNFNNGNVEAVNIENLDKGIYFVKMFYNNNAEIIRFVK